MNFGDCGNDSAKTPEVSDESKRFGKSPTQSLFLTCCHKTTVNARYAKISGENCVCGGAGRLWRAWWIAGDFGSVNGVGEIVRGLGEGLRRLQTGSARAYAASLFFGVVVVVGYYLWR